jgi:putative ABC transport system permease protein
MMFVDDETYLEYMKELGLSPNDFGMDQGKLIAVGKEIMDNEYGNLFKNPSVSMSLTGINDVSEQPEKNGEKIIFQFVDKAPEIMWKSGFTGFCAFAPYSSINQFENSDENEGLVRMLFTSNDSFASSDELVAAMEESEAIKSYNLLNVDNILQTHRNVILLINVFTYGFVILISLITIANVFNTISTGIALREREFAMLRSVGMGDRSFNKMMNYECVFYGVKALLYGLPAAIAISYLMYLSLMDVSSRFIPFIFPWFSIGISTVSVFFVVFVTMVYATGKIKKTNVIDALKGDGI